MMKNINGLDMKVSQVALVVRDIAVTMRAYVELLGWGPWNVYEYGPPLLHSTYLRGAPCAFSMIGAETMVGELCIELIQPVSGESIYAEYLDENGEGIHHLACMAHDQPGSDAIKDSFEQQGVDVLMGGKIGDEIEFFYLASDPLLKVIIESGSGHAISLEPTYQFP